jgi:hypothetical protein
MATSFHSPVVLAHSLKTGLLSPHHRSVSRLLKGIEEDIKSLIDISNDVHVAVTWDASINACVHGDTGSQDCSLAGQLWQAADRKPGRNDNEETLNDFTADFGNEILRELKELDISAWFFRTAKLQPIEVNGQADFDYSARKLIKRRRSESIVSGNNFLAMYRYGMFSKSVLSPSKHHKSLVTPVAVGLGILGTAGTGALGWWFWDDIKKIGKDAIQFFNKPQKPETLVEKAESQQVDSKVASKIMSRPVGPPVVNTASNTPNKPVGNAAIAQSGRTGSPPASVSNEVPFTQSPEVMSESHDNADVALEPIEPSVEASIARFQILEDLSPDNPSPRNSFHSTGSEFHLPKGRLGKDAEYIRPLSDIQGIIEANGVPEGDWTHRLADPRPRRPGSGLQDIGSKRRGKVVSGVEKECLDQMFLEELREEQKEGSVLGLAISHPMSINKDSVDLEGKPTQLEIEADVRDASNAVAPPATAAVLPLGDFLIHRHPRNQSNNFRQEERESLIRNLLHMCSKSNIPVLM